MKKILFSHSLFLIPYFLFAQNIGIGITTPSATFDIYRGTGAGGTLQIRGTNYISHFNFGTTEDTYIRGGKNGAHVFINDLAGTGNVGIGTTIPLQKLSVEGMSYFNGNVGMGVSNPLYPLSFPNTLGDKISLWGGSGDHYGFGINSNRLVIHSATSNDDIAFGHGHHGDMTETFRMKGNGAFEINGNAGSPGQVLKSNGGNSAPTWGLGSSWLFNNTYNMEQTGGGALYLAPQQEAIIPGLDQSNYSITLSDSSKLIISFKTSLGSMLCQSCPYSFATVDIWVHRNGSLYGNALDAVQILNGTHMTFTTGVDMFKVPPGTYTFSVTAENESSIAVMTFFTSSLFIAAIPKQ